MTVARLSLPAQPVRSRAAAGASSIVSDRAGSSSSGAACRSREHPAVHGQHERATLVPDTATTAEQAQRFYRNFVTPGFFATLGIPITRGRAFTTQDAAGAPAVAIINEGAAKRLWGDVDPIGRQFRVGTLSGPPVQIVGVAGDARFRDLTTDLSGARVEPDVYFPFAQRTDSEIEIAVRTADRSDVPPPALLRAVQAVDAALPLYRVQPLDDVVRAQTSTARFGSTLFAIFSTGALLLAAIGLYGLINYIVGLSRRESPSVWRSAPTPGASSPTSSPTECRSWPPVLYSARPGRLPRDGRCARSCSRPRPSIR